MFCRRSKLPEPRLGGFGDIDPHRCPEVAPILGVPPRLLQCVDPDQSSRHEVHHDRLGHSWLAPLSPPRDGLAPTTKGHTMSDPSRYGATLQEAGTAILAAFPEGGHPPTTAEERAADLVLVDQTLAFAQQTPPERADDLSTHQLIDTTRRLDDIAHVRSILKTWANQIDEAADQIRGQLRNASEHGLADGPERA